MNLTKAIEAGQWEIAALRLLLGVSAAARALPPGGTRELLALLSGGLEGRTTRGRST